MEGEPSDAATGKSALRLTADSHLDDEEWEDDEEPDAASAPDDSGDEDWAGYSGASSSSEDEESKAAAPAVVVWTDDSVRRRVQDIVRTDSCDSKCAQGKEAQLQSCLLSLGRLTKDQRKVSTLTSLAVLIEAKIADRHRGSGVRDRFAYFLPMVGRVCYKVFCDAYDVAPSTVKRMRKQIKDGSFAPKPHGGLRNQNASTIDVQWLVSWYKEFAEELAEVAPVHVRRQTTVGGLVKRVYSPADFHLLPAYFTWEKLHDELVAYIAEKGLSVREPALATMRQLLGKHCPNIRICSPRSNVCDVCAIYRATMKGGTTADLTETFGKHTMAARRMRQEYHKNLEAADDSHAVLIMDYSQNLTLPSVATTPSQWYFLSLWSVSMFGIYFANDKVQHNYLFEERTAGKGSDEVISMLHHFITEILLPRAYSRVTIYADNCTGQNKNSYVVKFLLALSHMGDFEEVSLKFFVKGHTKNAVDRGFGHVRKYVERQDIYTMDKLIEVVNAAAVSSTTVHFTPEMHAFKNYKLVLTDAYKNIPAIRKFQVFTMRDDKPGTVSCYVDPDNAPVVCDLRRRYDGIDTSDDRVRTMFQFHLDLLPPPQVNTEKVITMHTKVRPYVPPEFQDNSSKTIRCTLLRQRNKSRQPRRSSKPEPERARLQHQTLPRRSIRRRQPLLGTKPRRWMSATFSQVQSPRRLMVQLKRSHNHLPASEPGRAFRCPE